MTATVNTPTEHSPAPQSAAAESLLARLDDPRTASALHQLLDNAELLAMLAGMLDGLIRRGETVSANLASGLVEARTAAASAGVNAGEGRATAAELAALLPAMRAALPGLQTLLSSRLLEPQTVGALETLSGAVVQGMRAAPAEKSGLRGLLASLRDPETASGIQTLLAMAKAVGRRPVH